MMETCSRAVLSFFFFILIFCTTGSNKNNLRDSYQWMVPSMWRSDRNSKQENVRRKEMDILFPLFYFVGASIFCFSNCCSTFRQIKLIDYTSFRSL